MKPWIINKKSSTSYFPYRKVVIFYNKEDSFVNNDETSKFRFFSLSDLNKMKETEDYKNEKVKISRNVTNILQSKGNGLECTREGLYVM